MESPLAGIILVNWNNWPDTLACLDSCAGLDYPNFKVWVVDNGSTDGSAQRLQRHLPQDHLIRLKANTGFAGGCNAGIQAALQAGAEYVWLLNNDAKADASALSRLVESAQADPGVGIAGSKIYFDEPCDRIWFAGGLWRGRFGLGVHRGEGQTDRGQFDTPGPTQTEYVTGCSLLARAQMIRRVGLLDEGYFLYWEDVDWSVRAEKSGWKVMFVPASRVWHQGGATGKGSASLALKRHYFRMKNSLRFHLRHDPARLGAAVWAVLWNAAGNLRHGRYRLAGQSLKALALWLW